MLLANPKVHALILRPSAISNRHTDTKLPESDELFIADAAGCESWPEVVCLLQANLQIIMRRCARYPKPVDSEVAI